MKYEHSQKVSEISGLLAKKAGYSCADVQIIKQAALLHDIGKCEISNEILNKPGKLTPQEYDVIKKHTQLGSEIIKEALLVMLAAYRIANNHHERWDGSGYYGLAGNNIDPFARLVAVADVLDALMSKRAYKDCWSLNEAFSYLDKQSGVQFDREIVSVLLSIPNEISALYN